jgi:hypothetical protein
MDWLQFISSLVQSLAWPIAIILVFYLLRAELSALIPRVEKLKYKEFEIELKMAQVEISTDKENKDIPHTEIKIENSLESLAGLSPRAAILESWLALETLAHKRAALEVAPGEFWRIKPHALGEELNRKGVLNTSEANAFNHLRELRNKAVHLSENIFERSEAIEYIEIANKLIQKINANN